MKATREIHGIQEDFEITPGFMLTRVPNGFAIGFIKSLDDLEHVLPGAVVEPETKTVWLLSYHNAILRAFVLLPNPTPQAIQDYLLILGQEVSIAEVEASLDRQLPKRKAFA